jgi:hypothetical protein
LRASLASLTGNAQDQSQPVGQTAAQGPNEPYQPGLGEIMALQQMRHIKL